MLPSFGFGEMVVIALLAIIVVGPKDLPKVMRTLGGFMARLRAMAQEFQSAFNDMDLDDEVKSLRAEIAQMKAGGFLDEDLKDDVDQLKSIGDELRDATDMSSDKT
jgi:sec-independent protein translocase protein TatB